MQFNRGKSVRDPIYLRKPAKDFWMEGDIYENFCKCLDQIFGHKGYFVDSFTPKTVDFATNIAFNRITVTDKDGDTHTFFGRVVDLDEFDVSQRGGNFRPKAVEKVSPVEAPPPAEEERVVGVPDEPEQPAGDDRPDDNEPISVEFEAVKEAMKRETEIETLNAELEKEGLTTEEVSVNLPKKKRTTRRKTKKDE